MERLTVFIVLVLCSLSNAYKCLSGPFHKNVSSPEGSDYVECFQFKEDSCCTADFTKKLKANQTKGLYNFNWDHCSKLSQNCARYIMDEECFYQCEPTLIKYQRPNMKDAAHGVPICASYCDAWFEACKDDQTCVVDWLTGFNYTNNIHKCPDGSKCRTFKEKFDAGLRMGIYEDWQIHTKTGFRPIELQESRSGPRTNRTLSNNGS